MIFTKEGFNLFSVMVVDDDPKVLDWLKTEIDWGGMGFTLICTAKDGIDALHKLSQNSVDVIISDISMPKMGGIELLNSLKESDIPSLVVFLNEPDDLSYVRQGMLLGVYGYLSKPINKKEVINLLNNVYDTLMEEGQSKNIAEKRKGGEGTDLSLSKEKILYDLLRGRESAHQFLSNTVVDPNINLSDKMVQVGIVEVGNFDASSRELIKTGKFGELLDEVRVIITDVLLGFKSLSCNMIEMDIGIITVILQPAFSMELAEFEDRAIDFFENILRLIQQSANIRVTIGIGEAYLKLSGISLSYMGAKAALRHKYVLGGNRIIHIGQSNLNEKQNLLYPAEKEKLLVKHIMSGDGNAISLSQNLFNDTAAGVGDNLKRLAFATNQLLFNITYFIDVRYDYINKLYDFREISNADFSAFESKEEMKKFFTGFIAELLNVVREYLPVQDNKLIKKACEYVLNNVDQEITLTRIADHLDISKNYFCSLFKQETGKNFLEYVTKVKMEWAKMLLRQSNYKTYKVSEMLGYREASYFSRLFRKHTGSSPAEYRKQIQKNEN